MDFNALIEDMRIAASNLRKETSNKKYLSSIYCNKTCKAVDKTASSHTDYDNVITGLWLITAHLIDQIDLLQQVPGVQDVALRLFRECAKAVLNIQWQNLEEDNSLRQNFLVSLASLNAKLVKRNFHRFRLLETLTEQPWTDPTLAKIMGGEAEDEEEKEEVRKYIENEDPIILQLRVDMMLKENCEEYAMNLCNSCLIHPELRCDLKLRKTQLTLLHKLGHTDRLQEECQKLSIQDALVIIRQLQTKANREICTVLAQTFMVQNWIRPSDQEANKELLRLWIKQQVQVDKEQDRFKESAWAIAKLSQSTEQIIFFIDVLREQCGGAYLQLYVDMCIFAINVDKGQMETSLRQGNSESAIARKSDMAAICSKVACLVHHASVKVARMCVLTAFALKPTEDTYESIEKFYGNKHECCGTCTKNGNVDSGNVNPATLYEVERLLSMLRPEYLSPENTLAEVQTLCKKYLQERLLPSKSKNIFNAVPVSSTQVEGPGKKKNDGDKLKTHNLFDAVSAHEITSSQVLLSKLRLQHIQNSHPNQPKKVIYSQPPQPVSTSMNSQSRGWPNILPTGPKRSNPSDVSAEHLGNIFNINKQNYPPGSANPSNYSHSVLKTDELKLISPSQQSAQLPQARHHQQVPSNFQGQIIHSVSQGISRVSGVAASQSSNQSGRERSQGLLTIAGDNQAKTNVGSPNKPFASQQRPLLSALRLPQSSKMTLQQAGTQRLPTVSTLLKPSQSLEQPHPTSKASLLLPSSSSSLSSYKLGSSRNDTSSHQMLQMRKGNNAVSATESQKQQQIRLQTENLRNLMQITGSQQKQQVFSKQMSGAIVTLNQSGQGLMNVNLPKQNVTLSRRMADGGHQSAIAIQSRLTPKINQQQLLLSQGKQDTQQLTQRPHGQIVRHQNQLNFGLSKQQPQQQHQLTTVSPNESLQFPSQNNVAISVEGGTPSSMDPLNSQNQSALPSDELSGSIMGIDDTIIKELLQDSGIFSNTFPDIEVEDLNKRSQEVGQSKTGPVVNPSRQNSQNTVRSQGMPNVPICEAFSMSSNALTLTAKSHASNSLSLYDQKQNNSLYEFSQVSKSMFKAPHVDSNTLNQRQFPVEIKPSVPMAQISLSAAQPATHVPTVEQLREKMRKEQIEGEVTMDASNNATYRCIICSLAFGELEELREHVRNVCKPGLQSSSVYNNKIEQDRAKSAKAGLETTTVFQCLRCFELCISDVGIKQHRLTCKRVPTVPPDIKNATLKGKTSPSANSSRCSTPKLSVVKKEIKDNSSKVPAMPLPFPYPSLNTKAVLESLSAVSAKSQPSPKFTLTPPVSAAAKIQNQTEPVLSSRKDDDSGKEMAIKKEKPKPLPSPSYSEISGSGGSKFYRCKVCSQTLCSLESLSAHWKECFAKNPANPPPVQNKVVHKSFLYEDDLEPGEIRPLFGKMLENVMNIIAGVAHGKLGNTEDFDSDAEASDFEILEELEDPCKHMLQKPFFRSVIPKNVNKDILGTQLACRTKMATNPKAVTTMALSSLDIGHSCEIQSNKVSHKSSLSKNTISHAHVSEQQLSTGTSAPDINESNEDCSSIEKEDESPSVSEFEGNDVEKQDSYRGTPPKLRDRNSLKPIQSFINESFISPYSKIGSKKISKKMEVSKKRENASASTQSEESEEENYICVACKKRCPNERMLLQHYAGKHLMPFTMKSLADSKSYFCHLCQKTFTTFKHYMFHVPNHKTVIFEKMKHSSPRRGTARPWSMRLASSRGLISRQQKKGKISPKLASALKSKKKAAKSARDRLRKCLSKKSLLRPSPLSLDEEDSDKSFPASKGNVCRSLSSSNASGMPSLRNRVARRRQSFVESLPQSDDSYLSSNPANSDDDDYMASEDIDSDSSMAVAAPPQTRNRKRSGQGLDNEEGSKQKRTSLLSSASDPSSLDGKDPNLLPVVSVCRMSEQEIEKYSKGMDHSCHTQGDDSESDSKSKSLSDSFQASFETYLRQSLTSGEKPKRVHSNSSSYKTPPQSSVCNNRVDQDENSRSSDQISLADTEASTVSYVTDESQVTTIKEEDQGPNEILSSLNKRRCSVNLGQKLDMNAIQTFKDSPCDKTVVGENPHSSRDEDDKNTSVTLHVQPSLFNCAVRLERTELVDRLLASTSDGESVPVVVKEAPSDTVENGATLLVQDQNNVQESESPQSQHQNVSSENKNKDGIVNLESPALIPVDAHTQLKNEMVKKSSSNSELVTVDVFMTSSEISNPEKDTMDDSKNSLEIPNMEKDSFVDSKNFSQIPQTEKNTIDDVKNFIKISKNGIKSMDESENLLEISNTQKDMMDNSKNLSEISDTKKDTMDDSQNSSQISNFEKDTMDDYKNSSQISSTEKYTMDDSKNSSQISNIEKDTVDDCKKPSQILKTEKDTVGDLMPKVVLNKIKTEEISHDGDNTLKDIANENSAGGVEDIQEQTLIVISPTDPSKCITHVSSLGEDAVSGITESEENHPPESDCGFESLSKPEDELQHSEKDMSNLGEDSTSCDPLKICHSTEEQNEKNVTNIEACHAFETTNSPLDIVNDSIKDLCGTGETISEPALMESEANLSQHQQDSEKTIIKPFARDEDQVEEEAIVKTEEKETPTYIIGETVDSKSHSNSNINEDQGANEVLEVQDPEINILHSMSEGGSPEIKSIENEDANVKDTSDHSVSCEFVKSEAPVSDQKVVGRKASLVVTANNEEGRRHVKTSLEMSSEREGLDMETPPGISPQGKQTSKLQVKVKIFPKEGFEIQTIENVNSDQQPGAGATSVEITNKGEGSDVETPTGVTLQGNQTSKMEVKIFQGEGFEIQTIQNVDSNQQPVAESHSQANVTFDEEIPVAQTSTSRTFEEGISEKISENMSSNEETFEIQTPEDDGVGQSRSNEQEVANTVSIEELFDKDTTIEENSPQMVSQTKPSETLLVQELPAMAPVKDDSDKDMDQHILSNSSKGSSLDIDSQVKNEATSNTQPQGNVDGEKSLEQSDLSLGSEISDIQISTSDYDFKNNEVNRESNHMEDSRTTKEIHFDEDKCIVEEETTSKAVISPIKDTIPSSVIIQDNLVLENEDTSKFDIAPLSHHQHMAIVSSSFLSSADSSTAEVINEDNDKYPDSGNSSRQNQYEMTDENNRHEANNKQATAKENPSPDTAQLDYVVEMNVDVEGETTLKADFESELSHNVRESSESELSENFIAVADQMLDEVSSPILNVMNMITDSLQTASPVTSHLHVHENADSSIPGLPSSETFTESPISYDQKPLTQTEQSIPQQWSELVFQPKAPHYEENMGLREGESGREDPLEITNNCITHGSEIDLQGATIEENGSLEPINAAVRVVEATNNNESDHSFPVPSKESLPMKEMPDSDYSETYASLEGSHEKSDQEVNVNHTNTDPLVKASATSIALTVKTGEEGRLLDNNQIVDQASHSCKLPEELLSHCDPDDEFVGLGKSKEDPAHAISSNSNENIESTEIPELNEKDPQKTVEEENSRSDEVPQSMECDFRQLPGQQDERGDNFKPSLPAVCESLPLSPESQTTSEPISSEENLVVTKEEAEKKEDVLGKPSSNWEDEIPNSKENMSCEIERNVCHADVNLFVENQMVKDLETQAVMDTEADEQAGKHFDDSDINNQVKQSSSFDVDEDNLSDYDLVIEEDTSYNKNVYNQALMPKTSKKEKGTKSSEGGKGGFSASEDMSAAKRHYQKFARGLKSLKERLGISRFEWDDFDEEFSSKHSKDASIENKRLLERKQNALKGKSESSPFMWDLEDSPEKQEQRAERKILDSDICKSLSFENVEEASNKIAVIASQKSLKRGRKAMKADTSNKKEKSIRKKAVSDPSKEKPNAKVRKLMNSVSPMKPSAQTQISQSADRSTRTGIRQRHKSSESHTAQTKPDEETLEPVLSPTISTVNDVIIDEEISFNTKSYSPIPPETQKIKIAEVKLTLVGTPTRGRRKSKKTGPSNSKSATRLSVQSKVIDEKPMKLNVNRDQERDTTPSSETKRLKISGQNKPNDPLTPKLKKAGLIRVAKQPSTPTLSPADNSLPYTRASEAALKAFNQKSLRNREIEPTEKQTPSGHSKSPLQKRSQENLKQGKTSLSPLASSSARIISDRVKNNSQLSRKVSKMAASKQEMSTAAVVKRRTPSLPRKNSKELFVPPNRRNLGSKQPTSTTIYRVDPLPKESSSKAVTNLSKSPGTVHTPLPPGVTTVNPKKKQTKSKWKIDKETKPTKAKAKQLRSPNISFRKT